MTPKYQSVSLPISLIEEMEKQVGEHGYVSVTEFVKDACRRRLEEDYLTIDWHTKRMGKTAFSRYGQPIPQLFPVFVQKKEYYAEKIIEEVG